MNIEVCLTPDLINQHHLSGKIAVVVDIFRATSCMVSGLSTGVKDIYPVLTVDACLQNGAKGMIMAGERGGKKLDSFDIGNSPFDYMAEECKGRSISVTTTNGTVAINKSREAEQVIIGAFLNISATADYIQSINKDIIIVCAGWKGTPNIEDTLYAGGLIDHLEKNDLTNDSATMALQLYQNCKSNLVHVGKSSAHAIRLREFGVEKDIEFCMTCDEFDVVVAAAGEKLVKL